MSGAPTKPPVINPAFQSAPASDGITASRKNLPEGGSADPGAVHRDRRPETPASWAVGRCCAQDGRAALWLRLGRTAMLPAVCVVGLGFSILAVSLLLKWHVPLPRCAFKAATGLPCFTCGSTRALAALGRCNIGEALKLNPLVTLICAAVPVWLGIALIAAASAPRLQPRWPFKLKTTLLWLAGAALVNWVYLLYALPD